MNHLAVGDTLDGALVDRNGDDDRQYQENADNHQFGYQRFEHCDYIAQVNTEHVRYFLVFLC